MAKISAPGEDLARVAVMAAKLAFTLTLLLYSVSAL